MYGGLKIINGLRKILIEKRENMARFFCIMFKKINSIMKVNK